MITGLAQREVREIHEIEKAFASGNMQIRSNDGLPSRLGRQTVSTKQERPSVTISPITVNDPIENIEPSSTSKIKNTTKREKSVRKYGANDPY